MRKAIIFSIYFLLSAALMMGKEPDLLGLKLFQDCEELEKLENYKGIEKKHGLPLNKSYLIRNLTIEAIEIGNMEIRVGKKIKEKAKRLDAEDFEGLDTNNDPFKKSAKGYVILGINFDFKVKQWEKMLSILKSEFGKPTEEEVKKYPNKKDIGADVRWKFEDGSTIRFQAISALGVASVNYNSNW